MDDEKFEILIDSENDLQTSRKALMFSLFCFNVLVKQSILFALYISDHLYNITVMSYHNLNNNAFKNGVCLKAAHVFLDLPLLFQEKTFVFGKSS